MKIKSVDIYKEPANSKHKYRAEFILENGNKTTKFGAPGYSDYTIHKDQARKERYIARHKKDLQTNDPTRAGESFQDYKRRINIYNKT
eukprot:3485574-Pleurochrysis_carterae.AAC.1